jgi:L-alanine-DL-glutamate epimerase-like enolase superfamily enzyme
VTIERLDVSVFTIPTEEPESDGTLSWDETTVVVVEPVAHGISGLGFTYGTAACAAMIVDVLSDVVVGLDPADTGAAWESMVRAGRNLGRPGIASMAIAAVDAGLWDLKGRLFDQPVARMLGMIRNSVPVYGSGGFTSYSDEKLVGQLGGWVHGEGIPRVKMKVATDRGAAEDRDLARVAVARKAIGPDAELLVDANGGYSRKQAVRMARAFGFEGVTWLEEPVSSDDLEGLREIRGLVDMDVAAGEYGYDLPYFERMAAFGAVDVLQVDASRCAGITEWLRAAAVAAAHGLDVSAHTAQSVHVHPATAIPNLRHLEYFYDHARVDRLLFDGVLDPVGGYLHPDLSRPGLGLDLKRKQADRYRKG